MGESAAVVLNRYGTMPLRCRDTTTLSHCSTTPSRSYDTTESVHTINNVEHVVRDYLIPRFGVAIADDIRPFDIQRWLKSLHVEKGLAWPTIAKIRGAMRRIYKIGIIHTGTSRRIRSCSSRRAPRATTEPS
jgi:hypothetical protein